MSIKTAFVLKNFGLLNEHNKSYVEKIIARNNQPKQKYIFDIKYDDPGFGNLQPKYVELPTVHLLVRKYNRFDVFKLLLYKISRDIHKDISLIQTSILSVDIIIKKLRLFHFDLNTPYKIILQIIKEQNSPKVDLASISFWYEIFLELNEQYPQVYEYKGDEDISVVSSRRTSKADYLSHLPNQLRFELLVLPKKGTNDVQKKWEIKHNGKFIGSYDYSTKFIHIIKELYDSYLEGRVIDGEELSREVDSKLGIVGKSEELDKKIDKRRNVFNKLRGSKREFLAPFSTTEDLHLRKHFVIKEDGCSFDPKEELGITFL